MSQSPTIRHSATLDSLRALSALVVLLGHVLQVFWYPVVGLHGPVHVITSALTETSVIVFFLLSGFLITASIDSPWTPQRGLRRGHPAFAWNCAIAGALQRRHRRVEGLSDEMPPPVDSPQLCGGALT